MRRATGGRDVAIRRGILGDCNLTACYEEGPEVFLPGLRDVVEAQGGLSRAARLAGLNRESLYRQLSRRGNSSLASLNVLLTALGLKMRIAAG